MPKAGKSSCNDRAALTSVAQGCSAWELGQEHSGEPGASKASCGSCAETGVELTVDLTSHLASLEFFHDKTESFFGIS